MPSAGSFFGLYVQRDALQIAQKALDITGNNISNINTHGYTRQRVDICSISNSYGTLGYRTAISLAGKGAEAVGVAQVRNRVLDKDVRTYSGDLCQIGVKTSALSDVEDIFDSIESDSGYVEASFAAIVNKLEAALQSFSADDADRDEIANIAKNAAQSLVESINNAFNKMNDVSESVYQDTKATVKRINTIFERMGCLNDQIKDSYVSMGYIQRNMNTYEVMNDYGPLELKDEMNTLIDELAQYGNVKFNEEDDGTFTIHFADQLVVYQKYYAQMAITEAHPAPTDMSFVITKGYVDENELGEKVVYGNLYDKDDWYEMHVQNDTGGDPQVLIRDHYDQFNSDDVEKQVVNITGKKANGSYYLSNGSLRGFLDVYNGRGIYADDVNGAATFQTVKKNVELANKAIATLQDPAADEETINKAISDLERAVNAEVDLVEADDGAGGTKPAYTVTINGTVVLDKGENPLLLDADTTTKDAAGRNLGDIMLKAGGKYIRTITVNTETGIEYYRDMLNAYAKTIHDTFNDVYKDVKVKNEDYDPAVAGSEEYITKSYKLFEYDTDFFRNAGESLRLGDDWINDPTIIANPTKDNKYEELDNIYINKLLGVMQSEHKFHDDFYTEGSKGHAEKDKFNIETFVSHICNTLGQDVDNASAFYKTTDIQLTQAEEARSSVMDVSMNEEGINMMNYQKWYNAISRMVTTLDEALEKLINGTGIVGLR